MQYVHLTQITSSFLYERQHYTVNINDSAGRYFTIVLFSLSCSPFLPSLHVDLYVTTKVRRDLCCLSSTEHFWPMLSICTVLCFLVIGPPRLILAATKRDLKWCHIREPKNSSSSPVIVKWVTFREPFELLVSPWHLDTMTPYWKYILLLKHCLICHLVIFFSKWIR